MEDVVRRVAWALTLSGIALLVGSLVALAQERAVLLGSGDSFQTHEDAVWVLGILGLVFLGNGLGAWSWLRDLERGR